MRHGDVVPVKNIRVLVQDGAGWASFSAPKGKCFVLLLLGVEDAKGGVKLDPVKAINELGWTRAAMSERGSTETQLREALAQAVEGVETALAMVERRDFIPDWDWLRAVRKQGRTVLATYPMIPSPPPRGGTSLPDGGG
jgi:hypothetical protein